MENKTQFTPLSKLNTTILNSFKKIQFRSVGAVLLGGSAGLSLTTSVIPSVVATASTTDSLSIRIALSGYATYAILIWGTTAWAVRKIGNPLAGAFVMGMVGAMSGLFLAYREFGGDTGTLMAAGGAAMVYGAIGGYLITSTLGGERPADDEKANQSVSTKQNHTDIRLFRFFR